MGSDQQINAIQYYVVLLWPELNLCSFALYLNSDNDFSNCNLYGRALGPTDKTF